MTADWELWTGWEGLHASLESVSFVLEECGREKWGFEEAYLNAASAVHIGAGAGLELCRGGGGGEDGEDSSELHCAGLEVAGKAKKFGLGDWRSGEGVDDGDEVSVEGNL